MNSQILESGLTLTWISIPNPLHVLEQYLLAAAVIQFRSPAIGVASDSLSGFKSAIIFQKIRDAGRPK
jgi:hypothetical protein